MSKTSWQSKYQYDKKNYDNILLRTKKGFKDLIKTEAKKKNLSVNAFIVECIKKELNIQGEEK